MSPILTSLKSEVFGRSSNPLILLVSSYAYDFAQVPQQDGGKLGRPAHQGPCQWQVAAHGNRDQKQLPSHSLPVQQHGGAGGEHDRRCRRPLPARRGDESPSNRTPFIRRTSRVSLPLVWCGMGWYGMDKVKLEPNVATGCVDGSTPMVWYGMAWYGMVGVCKGAQ